MQSEYKKIKSILRNSLHITASKADLHKNLNRDLGFCEWEVEYLLAKVENEFNVNIAYSASNGNITVNHLLQQIYKSKQINTN